jgi:hypothetical protein
MKESPDKRYVEYPHSVQELETPYEWVTVTRSGLWVVVEAPLNWVIPTIFQADRRGISISTVG